MFFDCYSVSKVDTTTWNQKMIIIVQDLGGCVHFSDMVGDCFCVLYSIFVN